jgi:hypothetical protein
MQQWSDPLYEGIDWRRYEGYELVTADRVKVGVVKKAVRNAQTGEAYLQVQEGPGARDFLRVPINVIGVITSRRLMLDVTSDRLDLLDFEHFDGWRGSPQSLPR